MSSENSDSGPGLTLSLVAQFDDINRLNGILNDGAAEECFLAFLKQMEWVRGQWAAAEKEAARIQSELDEALRTLAKWEAKFAHVRKLLDGEKRERNIVLKKYNELSKLLDMARDLLFNDNRAKLNDETLQKLAFLNGTAQQDHNAKLNCVPELNSTGTLLSEMSYSRSEDDLDLSIASTRRSWVARGGWNARENAPATKKRRSSTSSATKKQFDSSRPMLPENHRQFDSNRTMLPENHRQFDSSRAMLPESQRQFDSSRAMLPESQRQFDSSRAMLPESQRQLPESHKQFNSSRAMLHENQRHFESSPAMVPETHTVELQGGKVLATATTTLTLERAPTSHDLKPPQNFQPISESSDEAPPPRKSSARLSARMQHAVKEECTPSAPPRTDTDSGSETPRAVPQRTPSVLSAAFGGSPRGRPRQHNFVAKNFYKRETCGPCGKTIKFAKLGVKCEWCRAQAHPECRALLPLPCVAPGPGPRRVNAPQESCISDYAPSTPPMVPALLVHCINEVEKRGLNEKGIYRISATDKDVKRLKERFLRGCGSPSLANEDIHVLCGCIKDFLRSLREPLVTSALWSDFMEAAKLSEPTDATGAIVQAVSQLPQPNRDTLAFLVLHLQKVAESAECEMGIDNLAKIFGPTLIGYGLMSQPTEMYNATAQMFNVMQLLLRLPSDYWAQWACPGADAASPVAATLPRPRGFFFSPADTGVSRKKRNYFQ